MIWGLQNSHALNPKHLLPFRLNTSMPHRKLSPYAPIPLNPQKPQAVFWTGLITRETPELFVTCRAPPQRFLSPSLLQSIALWNKPPPSACGQAGKQQEQRVGFTRRRTCPGQTGSPELLLLLPDLVSEIHAALNAETRNFMPCC